MGKFRYVTNRKIKNESGEETGKVRVIVRTGSEIAEVDYMCPSCRHSEHIEKPWKRPFLFKCSKCGFVIRLPRLKDEIKRERKRASKYD